ncbi:multiubiquitin domain-containing protein [Blastococcus sp. TF02-8]|uniref:multiubiquitin domain-containing protein n=1 Tax=Blastococcus sp. TF02-8 TaxID=2250574 RepID=UPI001412CF06|nr:multiubiquitin domain-containing protein [Blastococcus sp. TF02-8]
MTEVELSAKNPTKDKDYEIVINGSRFEVDAETVTYEQVVNLGFPHGDPNVIYSVAYRKAKGGHGGSGTLVPGTSVTVKKKGTSFDVTATTRS